MQKTQSYIETFQKDPSKNIAALDSLWGEELVGDPLTLTINTYFSQIGNFGVTAKNAANVFDKPAMSYGFFHVVAQPIRPFGIITTGVSFKGLNMDIGHLRHIRWDMSGDIEKWIKYNKVRGKHASAMEHAVPQQIWVDKSTCKYNDENGILHHSDKPLCIEAISAVKALRIAANEGQKVYTINSTNANTALVASGVGGEIREAVQAGMEVVFHERGINAYGWSGVGYSIVNPETGVGSYLIEGKGNGSYIMGVATGLLVGTAVGLEIASLVNKEAKASLGKR